MYFWEFFDVVLPLIELMLIYVALMIGMLFWSRWRREKRKQEAQDREATLESKLRLLGESSSRAAMLSTQIKIEIDAMAEKAENATAAAIEAKRVADLSEDDRKAVAALVRKELGTELQGRDKRTIWVNIGLSAVFFVLGIVASVIVTMNVRPGELPPEEPPASQVLVVDVSQVA